MNTVCGIDVGTQSLKVVFYDYEERVLVAAGSAVLDMLSDPQGRAEQEANWWLDALKQALGQVPESVRQSARAVGVSGQQHGFVPLDSDGRVLAPVKLWCDTATQTEADEITAACGGREKCIEFSGNPVLTGYTAPKIRWLKKHHPNRYRELGLILLPHDYINFVMTGVAAMEYGDASGTSLLDVRNRSWSREMLRAVDEDRDLGECLPPLVKPDEPIGTTTKSFARDYGLPSGIPVAPGGGDNMMAAIGTGNVCPGRLTMSLGTSGTLFAHSDQPIIDDNGNIAAFCSSTGGWLPLLCTMNCTFATELMRQLVDISTAEFDETIATVQPGSDGLLVLPFFQGERTPNLPGASGTLIGLNAHNSTPAHLLRATVEGVTYGIRFGLDELRRLGIEASGITLTGGGAHSTVWSQIVADICELPVSQLEHEEGASFGAALQALWILARRDHPSLEIVNLTNEHVRQRPDRSTTPIRVNSSSYLQGYETYQRAVRTVALSFQSNGVTL